MVPTLVAAKCFLGHEVEAVGCRPITSDCSRHRGIVKVIVEVKGLLGEQL